MADLNCAVTTRKRVIPHDLPELGCGEGQSIGETTSAAGEKQNVDELEFEDPYGDDVEEEQQEFCLEDSDSEEEEGKSAGDDDEYETEEEEDGSEKTDKPAVEVWRAGVDAINEGENLDYDPRAYDMLHAATLDWSCLSFDIIPDDLGPNRTKFPHTAYVVAGTQTDRPEKNRIYVMKWSQLSKTKNDGRESDDSGSDSDDDGNDEENVDDEPVLDFRVISHMGTVNRIRCCSQLRRLVATWSETGKVHIWDINDHLERLDSPGKPPSPRTPPKFTHSGHRTDGFALDWNPHITGRLLSGDSNGDVFEWQPVEGGWSVVNICKGMHGSSVEDLKWKKAGDGTPHTFCSASVDGNIRIIDSRDSKDPEIVIVAAHSSDVNVVSWNPIQEYLLLSGGDDGFCNVWDIRQTECAVAKIHWHKQPISSVDWHPTDEATFVCSSYDDSISLWDLSVEPDMQATKLPQTKSLSHFPDQLMFHHLGQKEITETQWHPQIPGVVISTCVEGFNIFKTSNI